MSKQYDAYFTDEGKVLIYERGELNECGYLPDGKPAHESDEDGDWEEWVEEHTDWRDDKRVRVCKRRATFNGAFVKDLERKAQGLLDDYRREGKELGWGELKIDTSWTVYTYRASANWKDEPVRYTFQQRLAWDNSPATFGDTDALFARDRYVKLVGMADAAYELGLNIVFDKDFKVYVVGARFAWESEYEF